MKKVYLVAIVLLLGFSLNAQNGMRIGINAGLPVGDISDFSSFSLSADLAFLWGVSDNFNAGVSAGFSNFFGKDFDTSFGTIEGEDISFLPLAGTARFNVSDKFRIGADLGYAIGLNPDGNDGGFYYAPRVHYGISETIDIVLSYRGVSVDGGSVDAIALGIDFGI